MGASPSANHSETIRANRIRERHQERQRRELQQLGVTLIHANNNQRIPIQIPSSTNQNLPNNRNLSKLPKAAQDFINKNEIKRLARERNLNIHNKLITGKV